MPKNGYSQWGWTDMEELLLCPVCLDIPAPGIVEQCRHGHHICANCKKQVESCPLCKCDFHGTRNFVVEELIRHFDVLKNTMLLNSLVSEEVKKNKRKRKNTKLNAAAPVFTPQITRQRKVNTPAATKGLYPCRVHDCSVSLPSARLLNHVRTFHADILTEGVVDFTDNYNQTWTVPFDSKQALVTNTFVVFVRGIGLIYLNIETLKPGNLIVVIQMALKFRKSRNFLACIDFFDDSTTFSYNTRLVSVRDNIQSMMEKKMCYTLNCSQLKRICVNRSFKCKLRLSPFNEMESNVLTIPNIEHLHMLMVVRASYTQQVKDQTEKNRKLSNESEPSSSSTSEENLLSKHKNQRNTTKNSLNNCNSIINVTSAFNINFCIRRETQNGPVPPLNRPPVPPPNVPVPPPNVPILQGNNRRRRRRRRNRAVMGDISVVNII